MYDAAFFKITFFFHELSLNQCRLRNYYLYFSYILVIERSSSKKLMHRQPRRAVSEINL